MLTRVWLQRHISGKVCTLHLLFPSLARYFLLARFQIFHITNTWRKKECLLRVARVICEKTINSSSWSLYEKYDFPLCSKSSPIHVQRFAVLQTSTQRLRITFHRWSLSAIIHHRYKGWYCPTKPPPSINLHLLVCIGCSIHAFYPSMVD